MVRLCVRCLVHGRLGVWRAGGLPSQACPSSEMSNEIAVHIALFTILVQYMLVKPMAFAQQFTESLVIAVVF